MNLIKSLSISAVLIAFVAVGCTDIEGPGIDQDGQEVEATLSGHHDITGALVVKGALVVNGWYEEEEIYYIDGGIEEGVTERGENDIFLIGGPRLYQAQVVEFIPGEAGYSPHWNVNVVHTAEGYTVSDIVAAGFASDMFDNSTNEGPLFDDLADILGAYQAGLVTIDKPGVVVLCPVTPEATADAPGNTEAPEEFPPFPDTF
jgi:hypothetical protein